MDKKRVGKFPKAFRQYAVERLKQWDNIVALSKELGVHWRLLYTWRDQHAARMQCFRPAEDGSAERVLEASEAAQ